VLVWARRLGWAAVDEHGAGLVSRDHGGSGGMAATVVDWIGHVGMEAW
jgi:hypothetical protein